MLIAILEDSKFSLQNIYLLYIDFINANGSVDHVRLIANSQLTLDTHEMHST